jgi:hypothetical protein
VRKFNRNKITHNKPRAQGMQDAIKPSKEGKSLKVLAKSKTGHIHRRKYQVMVREREGGRKRKTPDTQQNQRNEK